MTALDVTALDMTHEPAEKNMAYRLMGCDYI